MSSEVAKPQRSHSKKCVSTRAAFSLGSMRHRRIVARQEGQVRHSISGRTVGTARSSIGHGRIPPGLTQETGSADPHNGRPEELRRAAVSASL